MPGGPIPRSADQQAKNQLRSFLRLIDPDGGTDPPSRHETGTVATARRRLSALRRRISRRDRRGAYPTQQAQGPDPLRRPDRRPGRRPSRSASPRPTTGSTLRGWGIFREGRRGPIGAEGRGIDPNIFMLPSSSSSLSLSLSELTFVLNRTIYEGERHPRTRGMIWRTELRLRQRSRLG